MTLAPLLDAPSIIQIHALAAIAAFAVGLVQLTAPKGTVPHRLIGWSWVLLMLTVAVSSLFIHKIRLWGPWSPIHLLSILVLVTLPLAVIHARRHDIAQHRICDADVVHGRPGDRRRIYLPAGPDHARRGIQPPLGSHSMRRRPASAMSSVEPANEKRTQPPPWIGSKSRPGVTASPGSAGGGRQKPS